MRLSRFYAIIACVFASACAGHGALPSTPLAPHAPFGVTNRATTSGPTFFGVRVPTSGSVPTGITTGPDGNVWFTEAHGNKIGKLDTNNRITEFPVPTASSNPAHIVAGADGNLWFDERFGNKIAKINPSTGAITEYPLAVAKSGADGVALSSTSLGGNGDVWFCEMFNNKVGFITPSGQITEIKVPTPHAQPAFITQGLDGTMWFTEAKGNKIGHVKSDMTIAEFPVPTASSVPSGIAAGADGKLWFTELAASKLGSMSTFGQFQEFPTTSPNEQPIQITAGPPGKNQLWFTNFAGNEIGVYNLNTQTIAEYILPTPSAGPHDISFGAAGFIWFTESKANNIAFNSTP